MAPATGVLGCPSCDCMRLHPTACVAEAASSGDLVARGRTGRSPTTTPGAAGSCQHSWPAAVEAAALRLRQQTDHPASWSTTPASAGQAVDQPSQRGAGRVPGEAHALTQQPWLEDPAGVPLDRIRAAGHAGNASDPGDANVQARFGRGSIPSSPCLLYTSPS